MLPSTWHEPDVRPKPTIKPTRPTGPPSPFDAQATRAFDALKGPLQGIAKLAEVDGGGGTPGGEVAGPTTRGLDGKPGTGPRGTYKPHSPGGLDTGPIRDASLCTGNGCGGAAVALTTVDPPTPEDPNPLTEKDIDDVIHAAKGRLTYCYQRGRIAMRRSPAPCKCGSRSRRTGT